MEVKVSIKLDGSKWCVLEGEDLQTGIAGFGDTQEAAFRNYLKAKSQITPCPHCCSMTHTGLTGLCGKCGERKYPEKWKATCERAAMLAVEAQERVIGEAQKPA